MPKKSSNLKARTKLYLASDQLLLIAGAVLLIGFLLLTVKWMQKPTKLNSEASVSSSALTDVIKNGSFEKDGDNNKIPDLWRVTNTETVDRITNETSSFGPRSFVFNRDSNGQKNEWISQTLQGTWPAGQFIELGVHYKGENIALNSNTPSVVLEAHLPDGRVSGAGFALEGGTYGWRSLRQRFYLLYPSVKLVVKLKAGIGTGKIWFDNVTMSMTPPPSPSNQPSKAPTATPRPSGVVLSPTPTLAMTPPVTPTRAISPTRMPTPTMVSGSKVLNLELLDVVEEE